MESPLRLDSAPLAPKCPFILGYALCSSIVLIQKGYCTLGQPSVQQLVLQQAAKKTKMKWLTYHSRSMLDIVFIPVILALLQQL